MLMAFVKLDFISTIMVLAIRVFSFGGPGSN
jgi:hypothetical protein